MRIRDRINNFITHHWPLAWRSTLERNWFEHQAAMSKANANIATLLTSRNQFAADYHELAGVVKFPRNAWKFEIHTCPDKFDPGSKLVVIDYAPQRPVYRLPMSARDLDMYGRADALHLIERHIQAATFSIATETLNSECKLIASQATKLLVKLNQQPARY